MLSFSRKRRWLLLVAVVVIIVAAVALHFRRLHQSDRSSIAESSPWALETALVQRGSVSASIQSAAVIEAPQNIVLSAQIQGTVLAIGPRAGVAVKRGELLLRIDARAISNNVAALVQQRAAAQADADYASTQQQRTDALLVEGGVSEAQAEQARATADGARAKAQSLARQIAALRVELGYAEIRAPQDAVVAARLVEVGDTVGPGKPVYRLTAGSGAVVRVRLPAQQLAKVQVGDMLELRQGGATLAVPVTRIAPAVDAAGLGIVEADTKVAPFGLPSGSTVALSVHTVQTETALTVPVAALVGHGAQAYVVTFVPGPKPGEPGVVHRVPVKVLQEGTRRAAVEGGLKPGEQVAIGQTAVLARLRDGDPAVTAASVGARQ